WPEKSPSQYSVIPKMCPRPLSVKLMLLRKKWSLSLGLHHQKIPANMPEVGPVKKKPSTVSIGESFTTKTNLAWFTCWKKVMLKKAADELLPDPTYGQLPKDTSVI